MVTIELLKIKKQIMKNKIKIAIQTKGRLNEDSMNLINEAGIGLSVGKRTLVSSAKNFPMDALFLRDDDIPQTVADGVADGVDVVVDAGACDHGGVQYITSRKVRIQDA